MRLMGLRRASAALAAGLLTTPAVQAAVVQISGVSVYQPGTPATVTFEYEPALADIDPSAVAGRYEQEGLLTVTAGEFVYSAAIDYSQTFLFGGGTPGFGVELEAANRGPSTSGSDILRVGYLRFEFEGAINLNAVPSLAELSGANMAYLRIFDQFTDESGRPDGFEVIFADLESSSIALVPLPAGLPLLAAALVGLGIARRGSHRWTFSAR